MTYQEYTGNLPCLYLYRDAELVWAISMEVADASLKGVKEDLVDHVLYPDDKERNDKVLSGSEKELREFLLQSIKFSLKYEDDIDNFIRGTRVWLRQQND
jgi:hypothetical protein